MANPLMGLLGNSFQQNTNNPMARIMSNISLLKDFRQNPMGIISAVYNVPAANNMEEQLQILLNSGKISQNQVDQYFNMAQMLRGMSK